jgi:hypothetical protein
MYGSHFEDEFRFMQLHREVFLTKAMVRGYLRFCDRKLKRYKKIKEDDSIAEESKWKLVYQGMDFVEIFYYYYYYYFAI